jgi:hypothetical protein
MSRLLTFHLSKSLLCLDCLFFSSHLFALVFLTSEFFKIIYLNLKKLGQIIIKKIYLTK